jgi:hypothetical protein
MGASSDVIWTHYTPTSSPIASRTCANLGSQNRVRAQGTKNPIALPTPMAATLAAFAYLLRVEGLPAGTC